MTWKDRLREICQATVSKSRGDFGGLCCKAINSSDCQWADGQRPCHQRGFSSLPAWEWHSWTFWVSGTDPEAPGCSVICS